MNKKKIIILSAIVLSLVLIIAIRTKLNKPQETEKKDSTKIISTLEIGKTSPESNTIKAIGAVKADTKISIVSMQAATVRAIYFNIGDKITAGQKLATLSEESISTSLINAQTEYFNRKNNLEIVKTSTEQNIKSSEINLATVFESLQATKIQLKNAQDNYNNGLIQIEKNIEDIKNNSVITYNNNLSKIFDVLNQIDYIIDVEDVKQLPGIDNVLAAKNIDSLNQSKKSYINTKKCYTTLLNEAPKPEKALEQTNNSLDCIQKAKIAIDDLIIVLDNTISSAHFSQTALNEQTSKFNQLRISVLGSETNTRSIKQSIENIELNSKTTKDNLENALSSAQNQVNLAEIAYDNAKLGLEKTKSLKDQQILTAEIAVDSTRGQLSLAQKRANDLYITSPINGIVTKKSIEIGQKLNPGQSIAEISQLNLMKIVLSLSSEDVYKIKINDKVVIEDKYTGFVSQINPAADPFSKKIEIEIAYNNENKDLIAESFVNVEIPVERELKSRNGYYLIPLKAVTISQNENYVYILEGDIVHKQNVDIGDIQNELIEIKSGLEDGFVLAVDGSRNLKDGDKVEIK